MLPMQNSRGIEPTDLDLSPSPRAEYRVIKMEEDVRSALLSRYYKEIHRTMLQYQSYTLGLFPRGRSGHARVRDNVYCASALWAFSMAYRHVGDDKGRTHELEQSAVKCMRGILFCYMRQSEKVEKFKVHQSWEDALHARFDCYSGDPVTSDDEWGHLQIDGTALFLLMLGQMTASGVQVIYTMDEVDFIQNLVYYVERAYRTPDFGMWERGSRDNVGRRELHASSIGMAKSALEAMNGINLFGDQGSSLSIIHVDPDAQYRNCVILNNLLPRESTSKETDASLLCITGYPAFAIDDQALCRKTEQRVKELLGPECSHPTNYGFKRFQRDGHHTVKENPGKKYYDPAEVTQYEGIECEWPLFYLVTILTELCRGHQEEAEKYWRRFEKCLVDNDGFSVVPRLYFIPESEFSDDLATVGSLVTLKDLIYKFEPMTEEVPFQWAQALHLITRLTRDGLITLSDLDPLGLHLPHHARHRGMARHLGFKAPGHDTVIQVALIAETTRLQAILATHGIPTQTQKQVEPIKIRSPGDILMKVFHRIGQNSKLGLSGRPQRPIGALGTSKVYRIFGQTVVFYPTDSLVDFYTSYDVMTLIDTFKSNMNFLNLYWNMNGKPTLCIYLTENRLKGSNFRKFVNFLAQVKQGQVGGIKVRLDRLQALISTSCIEHLEFGRDEDADRALQHRLIAPLRSCSAAYLSSSSEGSTGSLSSLVVGNTDTTDVFNVDDDQIQQLEEIDPVGEVEPNFSPTDLKHSSMNDIKHRLRTCQNYLGELYILHELMRRNESQYSINMTIEERLQEIYEYAGERKHWKTLRLAAALLHKVVDSLAPALTSMLVRGKEVTIGVFGYPEHVISEPMTPKDLVKIIYDKCMPFDPTEAVLQQEIMIYLGNYVSSTYLNSAFDHMLRIRIGWIIQAMKNERSRTNEDGKTVQQLAPYEVKELLVQVLQDDDTRSPLNQRQLLGALNTVPHNFYKKVFGILEKTPGGIRARGKSLPQSPTIYELVAHEKGFALIVEELFSNITFPEYRQMIIEALMVVSTVLERNPEVVISGSLDLDEILKDAMAYYQEDKEKRVTDLTSESESQLAYSTSYACHKSDSFYTLYPDGQYGSASYMARAVVNKILQGGLHYDPAKSCCIS